MESSTARVLLQRKLEGENEDLDVDYAWGRQFSSSEASTAEPSLQATDDSSDSESSNPACDALSLSQAIQESCALRGQISTSWELRETQFLKDRCADSRIDGKSFGLLASGPPLSHSSARLAQAEVFPEWLGTGVQKLPNIYDPSYGQVDHSPHARLLGEADPNFGRPVMVAPSIRRSGWLISAEMAPCANNAMSATVAPCGMM